MTSTPHGTSRESTLTTNEPSTNQLSTNHLSREGLAFLHDSMAAHVAAGRLPGLVTLVASGDDVHIDTIGTPSFVDDAPLARDAIFRIATPSSTTRSLQTDRSPSRTFSAAGSASAP